MTNNTFGLDKETLILVYKQFIRPVWEYASTVWVPNLSSTHCRTLQTIQIQALRIATGCTNTTPIEHLHHETKVLKVPDHLNMRDTQVLVAATTTPDHPLLYMDNHNSMPRKVKASPCDIYYKELYASLLPCSQDATYRKTHIFHPTSHPVAGEHFFFTPPLRASPHCYELHPTVICSIE